MPSEPNTNPYFLTPRRDFYLDIMVYPELEKSSSDEFYTIEQKYEFRPDKLANDLYGSPKYAYVFALRNMDKIQDPIFDFTAGKEIRLPNRNAVRNI